MNVGEPWSVYKWRHGAGPKGATVLLGARTKIEKYLGWRCMTTILPFRLLVDATFSQATY